MLNMDVNSCFFPGKEEQAKLSIANNCGCHSRNVPDRLKFDLRTQLFQMWGVDLTRIDGIDVTTALAVVSEVGAALSKFPTIKHFTSWLGLCPGTKITGGKVMSGKTRAGGQPGRTGTAPGGRRTSQQQIGAGGVLPPHVLTHGQAQSRHGGGAQAGPADHTMLTTGEEYTDQGQDYYEERYRERVLRALSQRAAKLGLQMVPITPAEQPA